MYTKTLYKMMPTEFKDVMRTAVTKGIEKYKENPNAKLTNYETKPREGRKK